MPFLQFLLNPQQRRRLDRRARTDREGSPIYTLDVPSIAASAYGEYDLDSLTPAGAKKYAPLNWIEVVNNDVVAIQLTLNGSGGDKHYIPAGSVRPVKLNFDLFRITNLDTATATTLGAIRIAAQRIPIDADEAARLEL